MFDLKTTTFILIDRYFKSCRALTVHKYVAATNRAMTLKKSISLPSSWQECEYNL